MDLEQFKQYAIKAGSVSTPANTYLGELIAKIGELIYNRTMITLTCQKCKKEYNTYPSRIKKGTAKTCGAKNCRYGVTKIHNTYMEIISPTYGAFMFNFDYQDSKKLKELGGNWFVSIKRGKPYAQHHIGKGVVELQRFLLDPPKGKYVDHINRDTTDNTRKNLRVVSNADNLRNGRIRPNNTSGYKGVWYSKQNKKWNAETLVNYKKIWISGFENFQDALGARVALEHEYWSTS